MDYNVKGASPPPSRIPHAYRTLNHRFFDRQRGPGTCRGPFACGNNACNRGRLIVLFEASAGVMELADVTDSKCLTPHTVQNPESLVVQGFSKTKNLRFSVLASILASKFRKVSESTFCPGKHLPVWWNWQTPWIQNPVSARTCGFDPRHRHHPKVPKALILLGFRDFLRSVSKMVPACLKR